MRVDRRTRQDAIGECYGYTHFARKLWEAAAKVGVVEDPDAAVAVHLDVPMRFRPVLGKTNVLFCLDAATRVLTTDLRWMPIGNVRAGDELIGFDEQLGPQNKLRRSAVQIVAPVRRPSYRIVTDVGSFVASAEHQWVATNHLGERGVASRRWVQTDALRVGHRICRWVEPWTELPDERDAGWLAGLLDGEGHVSNAGNGNCLGFAQKPGAVLERACALLTKYGFSYKLTPNSNGVVGVQVHRGFRALGAIRPARLLPKGHFLWEGQRSWSLRSDHAQVVAVESLGERELVGMQTSTGTFIAEGLLSHNSMWESPDFPEACRPNFAAVDHLIVPCQWNVDLFRPYLRAGVPIDVVPLGVETDLFTFYPRQWQAPSRLMTRNGDENGWATHGQSFQWLHVGSTNVRKGVDVLQDAWNSWRWFERDDCHLYVKVTGLTEQAAEVAVAEVGFQPIAGKPGAFRHPQWRVILDGRDMTRAQLAELYRRSHGFVLPSGGEGWGLTLHEAAATGLPIICTPFGGNVGTFMGDHYVGLEWSEHVSGCEFVDRHGILQESTLRTALAHPQSLDAAMREMMRDYPAAVARGRAAAKIAKTYTWERSAQCFLEVLTRVSGQARRAA